MKKEEMLQAAFEKAATTEERLAIINLIGQEAFKEELLNSYRRTLMGAINKAAKKEVAVDDASMLDNLELIAERYEDSTGYIKKVLSPVHARMLLALREGGNEHREILEITWEGNACTVKVRLIGRNGALLGIGICRRAMDQSSFDSVEGQKETCMKLALGKATADAYRDTGIGLFRDKEEEAALERAANVLQNNTAAVEPDKKEAAPEKKPEPSEAAKAAEAKPGQAAGRVSRKEDAGAEKVAKQEVTPPVKEEPKAEATKAAKAHAKPAEKPAVADGVKPLPIPEGYPTLEEALNTQSSLMGGKTYAEGMARKAETPVIAYRQLMAKGKKEEEDAEMKALRVIICNHPELAKKAKEYRMDQLFFAA